MVSYRGWYTPMNSIKAHYFEDRLKGVPSQVSFCSIWWQDYRFEPEEPSQGNLCKHCLRRIVALQKSNKLPQDIWIGQ